MDMADTVLEIDVIPLSDLEAAERIANAVLRQLDKGRNPMQILASKLEDSECPELSTSVVRGTLALADAIQHRPNEVNTPEKAFGLLSDLGVEYELAHIIIDIALEHANGKKHRTSATIAALILLPLAYLCVELLTR